MQIIYSSNDSGHFDLDRGHTDLVHISNTRFNMVDTCATSYENPLLDLSLTFTLIIQTGVK